MILDEHMRAAGLRYAVMPMWELYRCSRFCFHVRAPAALPLASRLLSLPLSPQPVTSDVTRAPHACHNVTPAARERLAAQHEEPRDVPIAGERPLRAQLVRLARGGVARPGGA